MRLIFVRHAESLANREGRLQGRCDYPLSDLGRRQAELLFQRFATEQLLPTHVYSSPLRRAMETAEIVSRHWAAAIQPWPELVEYDVGVFSGLTWQEIVARYPLMAQAFEQSRDWDKVARVEPVRQRQERACQVVETIMQRHGDTDVVVCFSHGGILQHLVSVVLGSDRAWGIPVRNTAVFEFGLDKYRWSARECLFNTRYWSIAIFNDASHLATESFAVAGTETAKEAYAWKT